MKPRPPVQLLHRPKRPSGYVEVHVDATARLVNTISQPTEKDGYRKWHQQYRWQRKLGRLPWDDHHNMTMEDARPGGMVIAVEVAVWAISNTISDGRCSFLGGSLGVQVLNVAWVEQRQLAQR